METDIEKLKYPIGKYEAKKDISAADVKGYINTIEALPAKLRNEVKGLTEEQLNTQYRTGGWTVRQVIHHLPDSHLNAYTRMKLTITEDKPTVKTYEEAKWAELEDAKNAPVEISLSLLEALHKRWVIFLRSLTEEQLKRKFIHPDLGEMSLDGLVWLYAWHCAHHLAHITELKKRGFGE
ncbi:MAG: putative metal-dependent hydrolase [Ignavibacteriae bacterium]|nr:MAG: putative metal-dependent hydrolase [Ignavibacteriota bacterium]